MPGTIIDSLFLELGIDTSKFSADQAKTLKRIQEFEGKAKRPIKNVSDAFRDMFSGSGIGAGASKIEDLSKRFTGLGKSLSVAGGVGAPLGAVTRGIGALLSPTALWGAAVAGVGAGMWDLNKVMTANNAAIDRQAQLTGTSAANMWAWAEAAKTVGANPMEISGGIAGLQTAIMGMGIGVGNASSQLIGLARLGVPFNFQEGANIEALFTRVNALAAQRKFGDPTKGGQPLGALHALAQQAGMNEAMWALATNPGTTPADIKKWINERQGAELGTTLQESLKSQTILGKLGIEKDILAETAYGGEQGLMQAVVELLTKLLDLTNTLVTYVGAIVNAIPGAAQWLVDKAGAALDYVAIPDSAKPLPAGTSAHRDEALRYFIGRGLSPTDAAAIIGSAMQESSMDPFAVSPDRHHKGVFQLDPSRQADFARFAGYRIGPESGVSKDQQARDQWAFMLNEPQYERARAAMAKANSLADKTLAFMHLDEVVFDASYGRRLNFAQQALLAASSRTLWQNDNSSTHDYRFGDINVNSNASNGADMARDLRRSLASQPLLNPQATQTVSLATRGSQ